MEIHETFSIYNIEGVIEADRWAKETAEKVLLNLGN
jgi:hypothetical protein